jgi:hypothetical protein
MNAFRLQVPTCRVHVLHAKDQEGLAGAVVNGAILRFLCSHVGRRFF